MQHRKCLAMLALVLLWTPQLAFAQADDVFPLPEEEVCVDPAEIFPLDEDLFTTVLSSELTAAYDQSIQELGYSIDYLSAIEQNYRFFQHSVPDDARHVIIPVVDGDRVPVGFFAYTTSASAGAEGADFVRLFTPDIDSNQRTVRNYIHPGLCEWIDVVVDDDGSHTVDTVDNCATDAKPVAAWESKAKGLNYSQCVGLGIALIVGGAEGLGIGAACRGLCATCAIPPHASCLGCGACAIGYLGCVFGLWWSC